MSDNLVDATGQNRTFDEMAEAVEALKSGGGGGNSGGMEPRIAKLEAGVEHLQNDMRDAKLDLKTIQSEVAAVKERLAGLEVKVDHLPSKGFIVSSSLLALAVIAALLAFQDQMQFFIGTDLPATEVSK